MIKRALPYLTLFTSLGTLLCCALPALLVSLGMGAFVAGTVSAVPGLIVLSEHKNAVFGLSAFLLILAAGAHYFARNRSCPLDPELAAVCQRGRRYTTFTLLSSGVIFSVGAFFVYVAPLLR